jgi:holo-[acyl-carrier protein] synthase
MNNLRTGVDIIEIERIDKAIQKHGQRFLRRIYTQRELALVGKNTASLAGRFAAKEAVAKAMHTGIGDITWKEIEILHGQYRQPSLFLHGNAKRIANELNLSVWSLSISHNNNTAIAFVVAQGSRKP